MHSNYYNSTTILKAKLFLHCSIEYPTAQREMTIVSSSNVTHLQRGGTILGKHMQKENLDTQHHYLGAYNLI